VTMANGSNSATATPTECAGGQTALGGYYSAAAGFT